MEFISSMTANRLPPQGRVEGAADQRAFNALPPIIDLNNALVGYLLTEYRSSFRRRGMWDPTTGWTTISAF